jgi:hypothetical protein
MPTEKVRIVFDLTMDDERWVQDALALKLASTVLEHSEEFSVQPGATVFITTPGTASNVRRSTLEDLHHDDL